MFFHVASFLSFPVLSMFRETNAKRVMGFAVSAKSHMLVPLRSTCHLGFVGVGNVEWAACGGKGFRARIATLQINTSLFLNIVSGRVSF